VQDCPEMGAVRPPTISAAEPPPTLEADETSPILQIAHP
jgi:hypothetical protein